ncbi:DJ-1/PfpI family protein [Polymorphobacter fuscus]|uniref:DJ-1/PfpI family protein n=1 Tax=Sandarakinorhabdus fusca TaxID=1439888 RepID=A0A7C9KJA6_9SPHN|nr:DJ-1/PfpI family protein [Polymorphobacter fuscus]KAB7645472.1 DJ-1/PfpI family protein [Polymorphobacter fuscus]MQT17901.1 DJ-1/PfpI family protein [Polymorphobacter fuscus]NJC08530.1 cyclohexyl-isocyanide hydratase [Polymorphobacter fuscus]
MPQPTHIGFLLWPDLTQLDMTGPAQVLSRMPGARLHYVWKSRDPVMSDCGLALVPTTTFADCPPLDILCIPGGVGIAPVMRDAEVLAWLRRQAETAKLVTSVCTGSLILAAAGLLRGYRAGCHWAAGEQLVLFGATFVADRVVIDRDRITAGGVTSGIDFAFRIIEQTHGRDVAEAIQLALEYDPEPIGGGTPATARPEILAQVRAAMAGRLATREAEVAAIAAGVS